eukprot:2350284-Lingulodinium_polyedra.AAC.1
MSGLSEFSGFLGQNVPGQGFPHQPGKNGGPPTGGAGACPAGVPPRKSRKPRKKPDTIPVTKGMLRT